MTTVAAVLLDTVSIQKYVFASNRLKENLGASYLVENIYRTQLIDCMKKIFKDEIDVDHWRMEPLKIRMLENPKVNWEIGYIGGGNALLMFRNADLAIKFIKNWTMDLLIKTPGLQTAVAFDPNFQLDSFQDSLTGLFKQLTENKNKYYPVTTLPKHGITAACPLSGNSADVYFRDVDEQLPKIISVTSLAKMEAAGEAQKKATQTFHQVLGDKYGLTNKLDDLGQQMGESHLAVVHIDGNSMGKQFQACSSLQARRQLSAYVDRVTRKAFEQLLLYVIQEMDHLKSSDSGFRITDSEGKDTLPIRAIVLNGDDVTFVTDGRLGVHLAEKYIEYWTQTTLEKPAFFQDSLSACAGVSITKTKFPFYRSYQIAEELCSFAKRTARKHPGTSWLDYHISYGGFSGDLADQRHLQYRLPETKDTDAEGSLLFGPYCLDRNTQSDKHINHLKQGIDWFRKQWPHSKAKELRSVLPLGPVATKKFVDEMLIRNLQLPKTPATAKYEQGWFNLGTPYFDMVELMEYYPSHLIKQVEV